ncbi:MAG TPA: hypothetical protein VGM90_37265 [Kofleriaceae bacterium]|jgi:hypothetical protein
MRIISATIFLLAVLVPSSAFADDTKMRVTEVQLGGTVHADSQFVEMDDPGEEFSQIYNFVVYDSNGSSIAAQSLPLSAGTTRVVMVNASAQDEYKLKPGTEDSVSFVNLQSILPSAGSVCFRRQDGGTPPSNATDDAGTRIHCMGWGNASKFPVSLGGTEHAAAPPAGLSLHKLAGCLQVDPPSPNVLSKQPCQLRTDSPILPVDAAPDVAAAPVADPAAPIDAAPAARAKDAAPIDASTYHAPEAPENGLNTKSKGSCSAGGDAGWLGVVGLAGLAIVTRRRARRSRV